MLGAYSLEIGFCVVDAPTGTETADTIPESIPELISGTETYVEFWVQDSSVEPVGITGGSLDFAYSTEFLDTEIGYLEYGQSFDLLRGGTADDSAGAAHVATVAGTTCDDTTAAAGTGYHYWVKARNSMGAS